MIELISHAVDETFCLSFDSTLISDIVIRECNPNLTSIALQRSLLSQRTEPC